MTAGRYSQQHGLAASAGVATDSQDFLFASRLPEGHGKNVERDCEQLFLEFCRQKEWQLLDTLTGRLKIERILTDDEKRLVRIRCVPRSSADQQKSEDDRNTSRKGSTYSGQIRQNDPLDFLVNLNCSGPLDDSKTLLWPFLSR
jgi:hypothetical protein